MGNDQAVSPNAEHPHADAVVFRAHFFDNDVEQRLDKLLADLGKNPRRYDVHLLVEPDTCVPNKFLSLTSRFDFERYRQDAGRLVSDSVLPGNAHLAALWFQAAFPQYERFWFIEYDVVYTGDWNAFLRSFENDRSDLLAAHIREIGPDSRWNWAGSLVVGTNAADPAKKIAAFFPVYRMSAAGLDTVRRSIADGWSGHFELLVPTVLDAAGLRISDIGGSGPWTPRHRRHRHYVHGPDPEVYDRIGTFRFRPGIRRTPLKNKLYHPCKTDSEQPRTGDRMTMSEILFRRRGAGYVLNLARAWIRNLAA